MKSLEPYLELAVVRAYHKSLLTKSSIHLAAIKKRHIAKFAEWLHVENDIGPLNMRSESAYWSNFRRRRKFPCVNGHAVTPMLLRSAQLDFARHLLAVSSQYSLYGLKQRSADLIQFYRWLRRIKHPPRRLGQYDLRRVEWTMPLYKAELRKIAQCEVSGNGMLRNGGG